MVWTNTKSQNNRLVKAIYGSKVWMKILYGDTEQHTRNRHAESELISRSISNEDARSGIMDYVRIIWCVRVEAYIETSHLMDQFKCAKRKVWNCCCTVEDDLIWPTGHKLRISVRYPRRYMH